MIPMRSALAKPSGHSQPPGLAAGISHVQSGIPQHALHDTLTSQLVMLAEWCAAQLSVCVLTVQVINLFNVTAQNFPDAEIQVSTLDAYFELLIAQAPALKLPVVTGEIGDSWIYGEPSHGPEMHTDKGHSCHGETHVRRALRECCIQESRLFGVKLNSMLHKCATCCV